MSDITLTFAILVVVVALFIWNRVPVDLDNTSPDNFTLLDVLQALFIEPL